MEIWPIIAICAAAFQTARFVLQKQLAAGRLSAAGATSARFFYSAPLLWLILPGWLYWSGNGLPPLTFTFWFWAVLGGMAQILATVALVELFQRRHFATGTALAKTETLSAALIGIVILADHLSAWGWGAIVLGIAGVLILADTPSESERRTAWHQRISNLAAGLGLVAGVLFGVSSVAYRSGILALETGSAAFGALLMLTTVATLQMFTLLAWLAWRDRGQIVRLVAYWPVAGAVSLTSLAGSFGWFWAFALAPAAYVKAVGQIEVVFAIVVSWLVFRERLTRAELIGALLVALSVVILVLAA